MSCYFNLLRFPFFAIDLIGYFSVDLMNKSLKNMVLMLYSLFLFELGFPGPLCFYKIPQLGISKYLWDLINLNYHALVELKSCKNIFYFHFHDLTC